MEKHNNRRPMRQLHKFAIGRTLGKTSSGKPTVNVILGDIHAYLAYTSPEELKAIAREFDRAAAMLEREVRGSTLIPISNPAMVAKASNGRSY